MRPVRGDALLALLFLAGTLAERLVAPAAEGSVLANVAGALAMSVPLAWRRRLPAAWVLAVMTGALVNELIATDTDELFSAIVLLIVIGYTATRHFEGRDRRASLAVAFVGVGALEVVAGAGDPSFVWLVIASAAAGGAALRGRAKLTRELAERTHELDALRELGERDAALAERRRIARELHDVVAHTVSVMVVQAAGARRQAAQDAGRALAALDQVEATGRATLDELERLFGMLQASAEPEGLDELPALLDRVRAAGLEVTCDVEGERRDIGREASLAAYRVVQEALTNTLKHAGPATAHVAVRWTGDALDVAVTDTGSGAPRGAGARRGLVGMRERMAMLGGEVQAGPRRDGGFEVRARLPLARQEVQVV